jgi:hypothetical protein
MTLAEANVKFKTEGVDKVVSGINKVGDSLDTNAQKARSFASAVSSTAIGTAIGNWITDLPSKFLNLGKEMFNASVEAESMNARMMSMSKTAAEASKEIALIKNIALVSPITTKDTFSYALALKSVGFNLQFALPLLAKMAAAKGPSPERMQAFTQVMTKLASGIMPDAEQAITAGLPGLKAKLAAAGLKFDPKGSIAASAAQSMKALQIVVQKETGKAMDLMSQTTETKLASFQDALDNFYIKGGDVVKKFFTPMIEAATKALDLLSQSGALTKLLNTFFQPIFGPIGDVAKNFNKNGLTDQGLQNLAKIMATISVIPENMKIAFNYLKDIFQWWLNNVARMFGKEAPSKAPLGMSQAKSPLDYLKSGDILGAISGGQFSYDALMKSRPTIKLPTINEMVFGLKPGQTLVDQMMQGIGKNINTGNFPKFGGFKGGDVKGFYDILKAGQGKMGGDVNIPEPTGPPGTFLQMMNNASEKEKKSKEKNQRALDQIRDNTKKANELTLREFTFGGGILAQQGVSPVQMSSGRQISTPQINATDDISRGFQKAIRGYASSNNQNLSFRRS